MNQSLFCKSTSLCSLTTNRNRTTGKHRCFAIRIKALKIQTSTSSTVDFGDLPFAVKSYFKPLSQVSGKFGTTCLIFNFLSFKLAPYRPLMSFYNYAQRDIYTPKNQEFSFLGSLFQATFVRFAKSPLHPENFLASRSFLSTRNTRVFILDLFKLTSKLNWFLNRTSGKSFSF